MRVWCHVGYRGACLCSPGPMFPGSYVPRVLCTPLCMRLGNIGLCSPLFPNRVLCSPICMWPGNIGPFFNHYCQIPAEITTIACIYLLWKREAHRAFGRDIIIQWYYVIYYHIKSSGSRKRQQSLYPPCCSSPRTALHWVGRLNADWLLRYTCHSLATLLNADWLSSREYRVKV